MSIVSTFWICHFFWTEEKAAAMEALAKRREMAYVERLGFLSTNWATSNDGGPRFGLGCAFWEQGNIML